MIFLVSGGQRLEVDAYMLGQGQTGVIRMWLDENGWLLGCEMGHMGEGETTTWIPIRISPDPVNQFIVGFWRQNVRMLALGDYDLGGGGLGISQDVEYTDNVSFMKARWNIKKREWASSGEKMLPEYTVSESASIAGPVTILHSWEGRWRLGDDGQLLESNGLFREETAGKGNAIGYQLRRITTAEALKTIAADRSGE